jgi:hypothetical protein
MYCDTRLGPNGKWYSSEPKGVGLRLPDYIKSTVCFLCVESQGKTVYGGTGFFVTLESIKHPELAFSYLVTAKHCVLKAYERFGHLKARSNRKDGLRPALVELDKNQWAYPEDPGVDIAVMPVNINPIIDALCLPSENFATDKSIEKFGIGIGDDTMTVGLFTQRYGKKLNIPIVRSGIIAAMPEEILYDNRTGAEFHAYLIETRSIGGLSGSPVFASVPPHRSLGFNKERPFDGYSVPIGVIRSHWEIEMSLDDSLDGFVNEGKLNMGIAAVTPIQELTKLIEENEDFKKQREAMEKALVEGQLMVEDAAFQIPRPRRKL